MIVAAGSPNILRPTRQTISAETTVKATGTSRSASQPLPKTQKTGTVRNTSWVPPYPCPQ